MHLQNILAAFLQLWKPFPRKLPAFWGMFVCDRKMFFEFPLPEEKFRSPKRKYKWGWSAIVVMAGEQKINEKHEFADVKYVVFSNLFYSHWGYWNFTLNEHKLHFATKHAK